MQIVQYFAADGKVLEVAESGHVVGWEKIDVNIYACRFQTTAGDVEHLGRIAAREGFMDALTNPTQVHSLDSVRR